MRCQCERDAMDCDNDAVPGTTLCTTCERLCRPQRKTRYARVDVAFPDKAEKFLAQVRDYLPRCYSAGLAHAPDRSIVISGHDDHGWMLDGYVIPRLASGLIFAYEVK